MIKVQEKTEGLSWKLLCIREGELLDTVHNWTSYWDIYTDDKDRYKNLLKGIIDKYYKNTWEFIPIVDIVVKEKEFEWKNMDEKGVLFRVTVKDNMFYKSATLPNDDEDPTPFKELNEEMNKQYNELPIKQITNI